MLDPPLRAQGINTLPSGNVVRRRILLQALAAAKSLGWTLTNEPKPARRIALSEQVRHLLGTWWLFALILGSWHAICN
jgi:hypothetical protein